MILVRELLCFSFLAIVLDYMNFAILYYFVALYLVAQQVSCCLESTVHRPNSVKPPQLWRLGQSDSRMRPGDGGESTRATVSHTSQDQNSF